MSLALGADTISVRETLNLLDGPFGRFAAGVAEDRYALWLGSGISLGRLDGLGTVVPRVVEFLRSRIAAADPNCRFRKALTEVLGLAHLSGEETARIDLARSFADWPDSLAITKRLIGNYSRLLDVQVDDERDDYLLWEGVGLLATFADPSLEPDVEHLCIGILILEGVASDIASANWDALIEKAVSALTPGQALVVCIRADDVREPALRARLFKFHGCATKAAEDEGTYRSYLIARQSQITGWVVRPENAVMAHRLIDLIAAKPTLMIGLSAQDANIQGIFAHAEVRLAWPWPGERPSYVFSEDVLGVDQQVLLRNVYRAAYTPDTRQQISESALIRAFAKPLLVALVLHVLCSKIRRLIDLAPGALDVDGRDRLKDGVIALRNRVCATAEPDRLVFVRSLIEHSERIVSMFRDGRLPVPLGRYNPITPTPLQRIEGDESLPASGLREVAVATGILGVVANEGVWSVEAVDPGDSQGGALRLNSATGSAKVFFAANSHAALCLRHNGHLTESDENVLVQSLEITPAMPRSPRGAPGRTGRIGPREVSIANLLEVAASSEELVRCFREGVAL